MNINEEIEELMEKLAIAAVVKEDVSLDTIKKLKNIVDELNKPKVLKKISVNQKHIQIKCNACQGKTLIFVSSKAERNKVKNTLHCNNCQVRSEYIYYWK